ncbi:MAG: hypothetical protein J6B41_05870 [Alistipes sp.]|nr:hypothetical protein [Alistipes sp.]
MKTRLMIIVCLLAIVLPCATFAKTITKVTISIDEPTVGGLPPQNASVPETASTEITAVSWSGEFDGEKFIQGNNYSVTIKIKVKDSSANTFSPTSTINATVNGKKARASYVGAKNITVKYTWKTLGGENPNTPQYKIKSQLAELAKAYTATNATDDKEVLEYLRKKLPQAEIWCAGGTYKYTRKMPSETKDGNFSMTIGITMDGITIERYGFLAVIPALNKSEDATNLDADRVLMEAALRDFDTTAKTTPEEILAALNAAATHGTQAAWGDKFAYDAPSSNSRGSIVGDIIISLGDKRAIISAHKVLPIDGTPDDAAVDADFSAILRALKAHKVTKNTTEQELMAIANAAIKNDSKLTCTGFSVSLPDYDREGKVVLNMELELNGKTRIPRFAASLPKEERRLENFPDGWSVNYDEWEVLRLTNIERHKKGVGPLIMAPELITTADLRAKEITQEYSHTRPNGSPFYVAIDHVFILNKITGENIAKMAKTPEQVVTAWMNSPGHRANILKEAFTYFGCGVAVNRDVKHWVQLFATGGGMVTAKTSNGVYHFETIEQMEQAIVICTTNEGYTGYIPLEADCMIRNGNSFTYKLEGTSITVTVANINE